MNGNSGGPSFASIDEAWDSPLKQSVDNDMKKWEELQRVNLTDIKPPWNDDQRDRDLRSYQNNTAPPPQTNSDYLQRDLKSLDGISVSNHYSKLEFDDEKSGRSSYYDPRKNPSIKTSDFTVRHQKQPKRSNFFTAETDSDTESENIPKPNKTTKVVVYKTRESVDCKNVHDHIHVCPKCKKENSMGIIESAGEFFKGEKSYFLLGVLITLLIIFIFQKRN